MADPEEILNDDDLAMTEVAGEGKSPDGEPAANVPFDAAYDVRRQRIFDHRVEAQEDPHTIIACLAGVNSDLMDTELIVGETLRQGLAASGGTLESIERHQPLIDLVLRLSKQITQVAQIEQRARQDHSKGGSSKPR